MKNLYLILIIFVPLLTKAQITLIPDATFEKLLINMNIDSDGLVNGQILTSDAHNVTHLDLGYAGGSFRIQNLAGLEAFINLEYIEGHRNGVGTTMNLSTLTKLKTLVFPSNWLSNINLLANKDLETLIIGNGDYEFLQYNHMTKLDLSNNTKLKYINAYNLYTLQWINMRNNMEDSLRIVLGDENNDPYNICIEVDDYVAATNGTAPYDTWNITNSQSGNHYFSDNCVLNVEKFVNGNFKIYPNPTSDFISIEQKETKNTTLQAIQILDSSGKWIRSVKKNFNQINVSDLSKGMYLFVIQTDKGNKTEKIVIK